jgi:hypothetical protein
MKEKDEYTSAENYIFEMKEKDSIEWLPSGRSICITKIDDPESYPH